MDDADRSRRLRFLGMTAVGCFLVVVVLSAWFALGRAEQRARDDIGASLQTVLQTTQESLRIWIDDRKRETFEITRSPILQTLVLTQIEYARAPGGLSEDIVSEDLRSWLRDQSDAAGDSFVVINPDGIVLASADRSNFGRVHEIAKERLDLLERALAGESVFVPPVNVRAGPEGRGAEPAMFFLAPIHETDQGKVVAALAAKYDPGKEFSRITQLGRIGRSGETYAIDGSGRLISNSRFDDQLEQIGLVAKGETGVLKIQIRDPGGNRLEGEPSLGSVQDWPLTVMAAAATKGESGANIEGYRDYRGVPVLGSWFWDPEIGIGLTTEIDVADALESFGVIRTTMVSVLGITVVLALGLTGLIVWIGKSANRSLQRARDELELRVEQRTQEVQQKETQLRTALDNMTDGIYMLDADARYSVFNETYKNRVGVPEELIREGEPIETVLKYQAERGDFGDGEVTNMVRTRLKTLLNDGYAHLHARTKDGHVLDVNKAPLDGGGAVVIAHDISEIKRAEEVLRESEAELKAILDNMTAVVFLKEMDGSFKLVNRRYEEMYDVDLESIRGKTLFDIYPEKLAKQYLKDDEQVIRDCEVVYQESTIELDGSPRTFSKHMFPVFDQQGQMIAFGGVEIDITERRKAEEAVRKSEEQLTAILETIPIGVAIRRASDGAVLFANSIICEQFQATKEQYAASSAEDYYVNPEDLKGLIETLGREGAVAGEETLKKRADGSEFWALTTLTPTELAGETVWIVSQIDITARKDAEALLRDAIESISEGIIIFDAEDQMVVCNDEYKKLFRKIANVLEPGITFEEIIDAGLKRQQYGEETARLGQEIFKSEIMKNHRAPSGAGFNQQMEDGRWIMVRERPTKIGGVVGIRTDITELKESENELRKQKDKAEQALAVLRKTQEQLVRSEKMASLGQLTAGIAHEIKNPLNFINNFSETSVELVDELGEVLEPIRDSLDKKARDEVEDVVETLKGDLEKINHHGKRADQIVKSMLLHARGDTSERVATPVNDLVEEAFNLAYHGERARDQTFQSTMEQNLDEAAGNAELVPEDITRVLVNLFSNAFYAVKKRGKEAATGDYNPTVSVVTRNTGDDVEICVRDNGMGISKEDQKKLFDPFFTTKPAGEGTGLGLSMSLDIIVQQHGGRIEVDSEPSVFTEFVITLPRHTNDSALPRPVAGASA